MTTTWDPDAQLADHADRYAALHDGRHPYTDAWPWAMAIIAWHRERHPNVRTLVWPWDEHGLDARLGAQAHIPGTSEHLLLTAVIAEVLHLSQGCGVPRPLGDVLLADLPLRLGEWLRHGHGFPTPGSPGWPAPTGPFASEWRTALTLVADREQGRPLYSSARAVLTGTWVDAGTCVIHVDHALRGGAGHTLADIAPLLPGAPWPLAVADPSWYDETSGLVQMPL
ncbi:hypothetical protein ACIRYZ_42580 [Kitasatospora sp. NPDC101155]|uniref:hypothetical protein n=1 Tax=Kitasatospora sp. NPDC101155 TaxID=3364097 RepID=UPI0037FE14EA